MITSAISECCSILSNETRFAILRSLVKAGEKGMSLRAIGLKADISRSSVKRHIDQLVKAGLVQSERQQRAVICRANTDKLADFLASIQKNLEADWQLHKTVPKPRSITKSSLRDRLSEVNIAGRLS